MGLLYVFVFIPSMELNSCRLSEVVPSSSFKTCARLTCMNFKDSTPSGLLRRVVW